MLHIASRLRAATVAGLGLVMALVITIPTYALPNNSSDPMPQTNGTVRSVMFLNNTIYIGGEFTSVRPAGATGGGVARSNIAAIDNTTGQVTSWNPGVDGIVNSIGHDSAGYLYIGGAFSKVGGQSRANVAALSPTGAVLSWNPGTTDEVNTVMGSGNNIFIGGKFNNVAGQPRAKVASITTSGVLTSWNPGADNRVMTIRATPSYIYFGGYFKNFGGQPAPARIAVTDVAGNRITSWQPQASYVGAAGVLGIIEYNNTVYVAANSDAFQARPGYTSNCTANPGTYGCYPYGGAAIAINGPTTSGTVKWRVQTDGDVQAVTVSPNAAYFGGHFGVVFNIPSQTYYTRKKLAALNLSDGSVTSWNPTGNSPLGVWSLFVYAVPNGKLYAGGDFTQINGVKQQGFARFSGSTL